MLYNREKCILNYNARKWRSVHNFAPNGCRRASGALGFYAFGQAFWWPISLARRHNFAIKFCASNNGVRKCEHTHTLTHIVKCGVFCWYVRVHMCVAKWPRGVCLEWESEKNIFFFWPTQRNNWNRNPSKFSYVSMFLWMCVYMGVCV